jgi:hypothetical protein
MPRSIAVVILIASLALPSTAAAKTFRGKTSQGRSALLVTGADGLPKRVSLRWSAPCKKPGITAQAGTTSTPPFTAVTADGLTDGPKTYRTRFPGGERARVTATLVVRRVGNRWKGTFALRAVIGRKGKVIDVCKFKRVRFTVR